MLRALLHFTYRTYLTAKANAPPAQESGSHQVPHDSRNVTIRPVQCMCMHAYTRDCTHMTASVHPHIHTRIHNVHACTFTRSVHGRIARRLIWKLGWRGLAGALAATEDSRFPDRLPAESPCDWQSCAFTYRHRVNLNLLWFRAATPRNRPSSDQAHSRAARQQRTAWTAVCLEPAKPAVAGECCQRWASLSCLPDPRVGCLEPSRARMVIQRC